MKWPGRRDSRDSESGLRGNQVLGVTGLPPAPALDSGRITAQVRP
jgi:hypothetical protein